MGSVAYGWQYELNEYLRLIENISKAALGSIQRDRIWNHLPFDASFKDFIVQQTSAR